MGFLDNTTNNIILDAVLTDTGRQFLARNDGSFSIMQFALGDDEVNYGIITKYGRTVGTEKIQKNTPVMEALTNQSYALKYKLISASNQNLVYLPSIEITSQKQQIALNLANLKFEKLMISQKTAAGQTISPDLTDSAFIVELNDMFLEATAGVGSLQFIDSQQKATYNFTADSIGAIGEASLMMQIQAKPISTSLFTVYGINNVISTYIKITGINSGAVLDVPVTISLS